MCHRVKDTTISSDQQKRMTTSFHGIKGFPQRTKVMDPSPRPPSDGCRVDSSGALFPGNL